MNDNGENKVRIIGETLEDLQEILTLFTPIINILSEKDLNEDLNSREILKSMSKLLKKISQDCKGIIRQSSVRELLKTSVNSF